MAEGEDWITVNGTHILVKEGESAKDATERFLAEKREGNPRMVNDKEGEKVLKEINNKPRKSDKIRIDAKGTVTAKADGKKNEWIGNVKWGKLYYSFDYGDTWGKTKSEAFHLAGKG